MSHIALVGGTRSTTTFPPFHTFRLKLLSLNSFYVEHAPHLQLFPTFITNVNHSTIHTRTHLCELSRLCLRCECDRTFPLDLYMVIGGVGCRPLCSLDLSEAPAPRLAQPPNSAVGDRYTPYLLKHLCCSLEVQQPSQPYCLLDYPFAPALVAQLQLLIQGGKAPYGSRGNS